MLSEEGHLELGRDLWKGLLKRTCGRDLYKRIVKDIIEGGFCLLG